MHSFVNILKNTELYTIKGEFYGIWIINLKSCKQKKYK